MPVEYGTRCPAGHWLVALSKRAADRRKREAKEKARKAEREKKLPKTGQRRLLVAAIVSARSS